MPSGDKSLKKDVNQYFYDINDLISDQLGSNLTQNYNLLHDICIQKKIQQLPLIQQQPVSILVRHPTSIVYFDVCSQTNDVASISIDGEVFVLNQATGKYASFDSCVFYPNSIKILSDNDKLLISTLDGSVLAISGSATGLKNAGNTILSGNEIQSSQLYTHNEVVTGITITNSSKVITLGISGQLKVYDVNSNILESEINIKELQYSQYVNKSDNQFDQLSDQASSINSLKQNNAFKISEYFICLSYLNTQQINNTNIFAVGTSDGRICIFDIRYSNNEEQAKIIPTKKHIKEQIKNVDVSEKTDTMKTPEIDLKYNQQKNQFHNQEDITLNLPKIITLDHQESSIVNNVLFHNAGYQILATFKKSACLIDLRSEQIIQTYEIFDQQQFQASTTPIQLSKPDELKAKSLKRYTENVVDANDLQTNLTQISQIQSQKGISDALFSASGRILFLALDNSVYAFDVLHGTQLGIVCTHSGPITKIALTSDKSELLTASHDASLRKWSFQNIIAVDK